MPSCAKYRKRLGAYLDGELSRQERVSVERHLAGCDSCRTVLDGLRDLEQQLRTLDVPPVPATLTPRILAKVHARQRRSGTTPIRLWWEALTSPPWLLKTATAAALFFGLTMGAYMGWHSFWHVGGGPLRTDPAVIELPKAPLYIVGALSSTPQCSIEAAVLTLMEHER